jgi:small conductance mechanosensitive channel
VNPIAIDSLHWKQLLLLWGPTLLKAALVLLIGLWLARRLTNLLPRALLRFHIDTMLGDFLRNVAYIAAVVLVVVATLQQLGVATAPLLAVIGTAGLAIGLALKDSLSNIAAGVMLVTLRPFREGDAVTVAGLSGTVTQVGIFQTVLEGADKEILTIPNNLITSGPITNLSTLPLRRIALVVGVSYGDDLARARQVALDVVRADARVQASPAPGAAVDTLADSSVNLAITCYVANADWAATRAELLERIKTGFDAAGISIPFPQRDAHVYLYGGSGKPLDGGTLVAGGQAALPDPRQDA